MEGGRRRRRSRWVGKGLRVRIRGGWGIRVKWRV